MQAEPKKGGEGVAELLAKESAATASFISRCYLPKL